jgi:hypothetical protein
MGNRFASGKNSIAICDRCGFQFKLTALRKEVIKTKIYNLLVCDVCWDPDQPQLQLGMYPVDDPQAVRNPRKDTTYVTAGPNAQGNLTGGSRDIQWGWNPVGGARAYDDLLTPNYLALAAQVGTVTVQIGA